MAEHPNIIIGRNVRARRLALDLTQDQLAARADLDTEKLRLGETGERRFTASELMRLTLALGTAADVLLRPSAPKLVRA